MSSHGQNKPVIFYGLGAEAKFAVQVYRQKGIHPVCFADRDPKKWGGGDKLGFGVPCYSLEEAIKRYPDFDMVVTPQFPLRFHIMEELMEKGIVRQEQLLNYEPWVKMKSCVDLHSKLIISCMKTCGFCCAVERERQPKIQIDGSLSRCLHQVASFRKSMIENLNTPSPEGFRETCRDCPYAKEDYWPVDTRLRHIAYGAGGVCQFNCIYCGSPARHTMIDESWAKEFRFSDMLRELEKMDLIHPSAFFELEAGEFAVDPQRKGISDALLRGEGYTAQILTNGGAYCTEIERLIDAGRLRDIMSSVDAGTRETFKRIKGVDAFEKVCENLKRYSDKGVLLQLKYIFMEGVNDTEEDVAGFIRFAKEAGAQAVMISRDFRGGYDVPVPGQMKDMIFKMLDLAGDNGLEVMILPFFPEIDTDMFNAAKRRG